MTILSAPPPAVRPRFAVPRYASWQHALKDAVRDPEELCRLLDLPAAVTAAARAVGSQFPLLAPRGFVARMRPGDVSDPLLRQVLPLSDEMVQKPGFVEDPVDDARATRWPGLLHKYPGRVLLVTTGACAVHCRYCFRRHFPYDQTPSSLADWQPAIHEIARDTSLREVILSGGDPLTIVDSTLEQLIAQLAEIGHLRRLRIHTRLPILIPERLTADLVLMLSRTRLTPFVVIHTNHKNELDENVAAGLSRMVDAGVVLLNQAVLLAGVNDTFEAQFDLCERLVDLRVVPYYLHQLDPVKGAAHFEVPISVGRQLVEGLRARLPGYAVPRYVQEIPGAFNKTSLA